MLGQFNLQKFVSSINESGALRSSDSSRLHTICRHLRDKSLYALGFCSELLLTPDDTLLFSLDTYGHSRTMRKKAILHHKACVVFNLFILALDFLEKYYYCCCYSYVAPESQFNTGSSFSWTFC